MASAIRDMMLQLGIMTWILAGSQPTRVVIGPSSPHKAVLNVHDENELSHDDVFGLMNLTRFSFPENLMYPFLSCNFTECQRREFLNVLVRWNG